MSRSFKLEKKILKFSRKCQKEFTAFFGLKKEIPVEYVLVRTRKELVRLHGRKLETWVVGYVKKNKVIIYHPDVYKKLPGRSLAEFWKTLKHEHSHVYINSITKGHIPSWLSEGLACFLAKQINRPAKRKDAEARIFKGKMKYTDLYYYGASLVYRLMLSGGKSKLLKLLHQMRNRKASDFISVYKKIYS